MNIQYTYIETESVFLGHRTEVGHCQNIYYKPLQNKILTCVFCLLNLIFLFYIIFTLFFFFLFPCSLFVAHTESRSQLNLPTNILYSKRLPGREGGNGQIPPPPKKKCFSLF